MAKLSRRLHQELETVCGHAIEEILDRKSPKDFEQILAVLEDESASEQKRQNAIQVLGRWGDPSAVPPIAALAPDMDERGLINALNALGELGGDEALREILRYRKSKSPDVRRFVVSSLERIGSDEARTTIAQIAESDESDFVRSSAQRALRKR